MDPREESQRLRLAMTVEGMNPESLVWFRQAVGGLFADLQADALLRQALGEAYEPLQLRDWRPSTPPPGWTWQEYEAARAEEF